MRDTFNKFNNTSTKARMLDSIYHMTILKSHFCRKMLILCRYARNVVLTPFHNVTNICKPLFLHRNVLREAV